MTDIILVLYGDPAEMDRCVAAIRGACPEGSYVLHIIDNNKVNLGFTIAVNNGIKAGTAPYVWLINQDAIVLPGAMEGLIKRMESDPKVGIVGSMQIDPEDKDTIRHGGTLQAFPGGVHKGGKLSLGHCRIPEKQTWVNFASVMLRREMIQEIGLLDENMFLLFSDSDYCYWARYRGWTVYFEPESRVYHRLGKASKNVSEWHQKDMRAFMDKWGITPLQGGRWEFSRLFSKLDQCP
jgi:N-acetylglucosaminyl-diphospho-decaprenol L-rhamnosyltransferase